MPTIKINNDMYRKLDALRQTDKGEVSFNDVISFLYNKHSGRE